MDESIIVSIVCPLYNEEKYIRNCLDSLLRTDYPKEHLEILFVDGCSTDGTRSIIAEYQEKNPCIHLMENPDKTVSYAMNIGIRAARGEYIVRIDAHAMYPSNYLSRLIEFMQTTPDAENVGGSLDTLPADQSTKAFAIAKAMSCGFGIGNSQFRIGTSRVRQVDTVPFGCFRRTIFAKIGLYRKELTRNQDDELNARIIRSGGKIYLLPDIIIPYIARDSIRKTYSMFYQYGLFKPLVNYFLGSPASWRQLVPPAFVACIAFAWLSCFMNVFFGMLYCGTLLLYLILSLFVSLKMALQFKKMKLLIYLPGIFAIIHFSYGVGYWVGLYSVLMKKKFSGEYNR